MRGSIEPKPPSSELLSVLTDEQLKVSETPR